MDVVLTAQDVSSLVLEVSLGRADGVDICDIVCGVASGEKASGDAMVFRIDTLSFSLSESVASETTEKYSRSAEI